MKLLDTLYNIRTVVWCAVLSLMPLLAGCGVIDDDLPPCDAVTDISISFRLYAGSSSATRAVEEYGTPNESYIDMTNLKVLIFDENKVLKEILYDNGTPADNTSLSQISRDYYLVTTKLDPKKFNVDSKFAIVALANWKSGETDDKFVTDWNGHTIDETEIGTLTIDDLKSMTFTINPDVNGLQPDSWMPGAESSWIPMFGSRFTSLAGYSNSVFGQANPMTVPDVVMVRAISKIEIRNNDTGENSPLIESIALTHRNQKGSLMQDYNFKGYTGNVSAPTYWSNDPQAAEKLLPFHQKDNTYTVYLPEMDLNTSDDRRAICVNLDMNGVKHQKWIYLAPYAANGVPNLTGPFNSDWNSFKRNYIYRYNINSLAFEFIIDVKPWVFGGKVHINLE